MKIAINGAGIAGPALAYWLLKAGHQVLLVEQAPQLRSGGYVIDFWGIGYDIAEKMGLLPQILERGYQVNEVCYVDAQGRKSGGFSSAVFRRLTGDRFTSVRRSDLSAAIYGALAGRVETIFGDSIASIDDRGDCVRIGFDHAAPREVELVIGADGLHSRVRQLVFGPETDFAFSLGLHVAAFEAEGYRPRDELVYVSHGSPGRDLSRFSMHDDRTLFLFVFRDELLTNGAPASEQACKAALRQLFADAGWESKSILAELEQAGELYFDRVCQIRMDSWTKGRVALIGDAAACISLLGGEGTGLAMAEAYALAGELQSSAGDHVAAFARYQERMMPFLRSKQKAAVKFAPTFAPRNNYNVAMRNLVTRLFRIPFIVDYFVGRDLRDEIKLPDYAF